MKVALASFTARGAALAKALAQGLKDCRCTLAEKPAGLRDWAGARFADSDALIFVSACGIAVRAIAPHVRDKFTDPAVVCVDEAGRFAIPLLSGHVGGANALAERVAALTGGITVLTTATDVNGLFAVDVWAAERGLTITDRTLAKEVSAALLAGRAVGFQSDFAADCPPGLCKEGAELGVRVTARAEGGPFPRTLRLVPRCLTLGIGCRKDVSAQAVRAAVERALAGYDLAAVKTVCTIDLKKDEPGLVAFCKDLGVALTTYTAEQLRTAPGAFTSSEFVAQTVGVDNVCERAAALEGGRLIVRKQAQGGVTVAAALKGVVL